MGGIDNISRYLCKFACMKRFLFSLITMVALSCAAADQWPQTHFAWGGEVSSSIDLTGHDLSTFNIGANLGYKNSLFQIVGVGGQINIGVGNNSRMYPVFAIVRTSFSKQPKRCFLELRGGYSFNNMDDGRSHNGAYALAAWGIHLAMAHNFRSYLSVGYSFHQISGHYSDLSAVTASIGINF